MALPVLTKASFSPEKLPIVFRPSLPIPQGLNKLLGASQCGPANSLSYFYETISLQSRDQSFVSLLFELNFPAGWLSMLPLRAVLNITTSAFQIKITG